MIISFVKMFRMKYSSLCLFGVLCIFALSSKIIFDKLNLTSQIFVDEEFHLPLGEAYCKYEFEKWHPKVTTFPGLYLISSLFLGAFNLCSTYWLRFISLLFSFINIILFYCLFSTNTDDPPWKNIISAINLGLVPPLYFFSHFYYTDVPSLSMILLLFIFSQNGYHYFASIFGMLAVLFRQTNIIWVGMVFACFILRELTAINQKKSRRAYQGVAFQDLKQFLNIFGGELWVTLKRTSLNFWLNATCYGSSLIFFLLFVYINGSIVVGDKRAHEATIHLPQLFYFSLFCLIFAWPHFIKETLHFLRFVINCKFLMLVALLIGLVIVHFNTLIHPYLLADNRHYLFYVWNRFYGKYFLFRYLMVPVYLFSLFVIVIKLWNMRDVTFLLFFLPCTLIVLVTQRLIDVRYFFIPYVLFRTHLKNVSVHSLIYEFLTYLVLNTCTLYLFFTKTIEWEDYDYVQRLGW